MSNMDGDIQMLQYIAKNADMGKTAIKQLLPSIEEKQFRRLVESQYREYDAIDDLAIKALRKRREEARNVPVIAQLSSYVMIKVNNLTDGNVSSMAEMMLKGSNQGIIEITKHLNSSDNRVKRDVLKLGQRLLQFEQENVEALKPYLKS